MEAKQQGIANPPGVPRAVLGLKRALLDDSNNLRRCLQTNMHCQEGLGIPPERWTVDCAVSEVRLFLDLPFLLGRSCPVL